MIATIKLTEKEVRTIVWEWILANHGIDIPIDLLIPDFESDYDSKEFVGYRAELPKLQAIKPKT